jgi:uncharacterized protein YjbI with pentapeptide repeats
MNTKRVQIDERNLADLTIRRITFNTDRLPVRFDSCDVTASFQFTQPLHLREGSYFKELYFTNCHFFGRLEFGNHQAIGRVIFNQCTFSADVSFRGYSNISLADNCIFQRNLTIYCEGSTCSLANFSVDGSLRIEGSGTKLTLAQLNKEMAGQRIRMDASFVEININECFFEKCFLQLNPGEKRAAEITGGRFKEIHVTSAYSSSSIGLDKTTVDKIVVDGMNGGKLNFSIEHCIGIKELKLPLHDLQQGKITHSDFDSLELTGTFDKTGIVIVELCTVKQLRFKGLVNEGYISLRDVTVPIEGILGMSSANMGKTDFIKCDFSSATLEFENARIMDIFLAQTDFPKKVVVGKKQVHSQAQLVFGQLRTVFDKQGDLARALEYQARELEAHYRNIPSYWRKRIPFIHFTKLNLGLNRLSNDFGRDWGRGVLFSLGIGLLCFWALLCTTKEYSPFRHWTWDSQLIASFTRFMNPLRFFDPEILFSKGGKPFITLNWASYVLDFIGRIGIAYGYYQTIQAFRRYGRK